MPAIKLTQTKVDSLKLKPGEEDVLYFDQGRDGFGLRLRKSGKRIWFVQFRLGEVEPGKKQVQRRVYLGSADDYTLQEARDAAVQELAKVGKAIDIRAEQRRLKKEAAQTFGSFVEEFLTYKTKGAEAVRESTHRELRRHLRKDWAGLHRLPLRQIGKEAISAELTKMVDAGRAVAPARARASLSSFFSWAVDPKHLVDTNPVIGTKPPAVAPSRERVLTPAELRAIWEACGADTYGRIVKLLILTMQRREEVGGMRRSEVDVEQRLWSLPAARVKNNRDHVVPLVDDAIQILESVPKKEHRDPYFGTGEEGFSGWSKSKAALDATLGDSVKPWRLHDLRRTGATNLQQLGVWQEVSEKVLNHATGRIAGVGAIYKRYEYAEEKRQALERWGRYLRALLSAPLDALPTARSFFNAVIDRERETARPKPYLVSSR